MLGAKCIAPMIKPNAAVVSFVSVAFGVHQRALVITPSKYGGLLIIVRVAAIQKMRRTENGII
jgi:hypothetical protein